MDPLVEASGLATLWFVLVSVLWLGYLVLEGFDFGVGMLLRPFSRDDTERRVLINTIGPVWEGNSVWLIVAVGATFAAFPEWYATMLSGFYLLMLLILASLIARGVAIEFRGKIDDDGWRARCDWAITLGAWVPSAGWGLLFANHLRGVELDADAQMTSSLLDLLSPYALLGAAVTTLLFLLHGAVFLSLKTDGEVRHRARRLALRLVGPAAAAAVAFVVWTQLAHADHALTWVPVALTAASAAGAVLALLRRREGWAFTGTAAAIAGVVLMIFGTLFPDVLPATDPAFSLTIANASATPAALTVLTWVAVALLPVVIAYQTWTYWVFRKRLSAEQIPPPAGLRPLLRRARVKV